MHERLLSLAAPAALLGGLLWIVYAIFLFVRPLALLTTVLGGAAALVLLSLSLLLTAGKINLPPQGPGRFGLAMGWVTMLAAVAAATGGLLGHAPLAGNAMIAGEVLLAFGVLLVAIDAAGVPESGTLGSVLFVVGVLGMLGLMAQSLTTLTSWMLPIYAALVMAVYGLAWVRLGGWLHRQG